MIRRLLIANRGEIACRIMRTCRAIGVETVAVYSDADANAPHVHLANEAVPIGPAPALESYLSIPRLIEAARRTNAEAVHPGYGFLSENADFAEACAMANLTFVGPSAGAMRRMGSKTGAREVAVKAGVPVVPGVTPRLQTAEALAAAVKDVGFPALIKAAAGGGGKGMRVVRTEAEVADAVGAARREAERSFANGALYVERLIERPRHIEVQILGDVHGDVIHVFERDCSLQRRHQKVIEETPAPHLSPAVRERITAAAVAVAKAVRYANAGTVEFLLEGEGEEARFYFLEMNTRLQVEHPITEAVTGLDLVRLQLQIAAREPLPLQQSDITVTGHALECRVYAEDSRRLLPQAGRLLHYREPERPGIRIDSGVTNGTSVPVHYDPLLAKVIAHGPTREDAFSRMREALRDYEILGVRHNLAFLNALLADPDVHAGRTYTRFIEERLPSFTSAPPPAVAQAAAAVAAFLSVAPAAPEATAEGDVPASMFDPWDQIGARSMEAGSLTRLHLSGDADYDVEVDEDRVTIAGAGEPLGVRREDNGRVTVITPAGEVAAIAALRGDAVWVGIDGHVFEIKVRHGGRRRASTADDDALSPPMPATVVRILVQTGARVAAGDVLIALEAMKMELGIRAPHDGVVKAIHCREGDLVQPGAALVELSGGT